MDAGAVVNDLGKRSGIETEPLRIIKLKNERTITGDADGDDVETIPVYRRKYAAGGRAANRVLARPSPKDEGNGHSVGHI